jgi:hypothetical protein
MILNHAQWGPASAMTAAIEQTAGSHRDTCDLDHPGTSAAVAILSIRDELVEYLVLGDVTVVLDHGGDLRVVTTTASNAPQSPSGRRPIACRPDRQSRQLP